MKCLITGITGQDGSYLAELLIDKGYEVYGLIRRKAKYDLGNVYHIKEKMKFVYGDLTDLVSLVNAIKDIQPDEVYNLAAQSFVGTSWEQPLTTSEINGIGVINILEAIRLYCPHTKFYQASTSEMFGRCNNQSQNESTPFNPQSPYAASKLFAHWITNIYRDSYKLYACSGILFNHESERRGEEFVTRKITKTVAKIVNKENIILQLGNLDSKRDWGYAKDYVEAMWMMLQQEKPDDYIIATNEMHSVREFVVEAFKVAGINIKWEGNGLNEIGIDEKTNHTIVMINEKYYRPSDVQLLKGDYNKSMKKLKWKPKHHFKDIVELMMKNDLNNYRKI